jgi:hypothetical protein
VASDTCQNDKCLDAVHDDGEKYCRKHHDEKNKAVVKADKDKGEVKVEDSDPLDWWQNFPNPRFGYADHGWRPSWERPCGGFGGGRPYGYGGGLPWDRPWDRPRPSPVWVKVHNPDEKIMSDVIYYGGGQVFELGGDGILKPRKAV